MKKDEYTFMKNALRAGFAPCPNGLDAVVCRTFLRSLRNRVSVNAEFQLPEPIKLFYLELPDAVQFMHTLARAVRWQIRISKALTSTFMMRLAPGAGAKYVTRVSPSLTALLSAIQQATETAWQETLPTGFFDQRRTELHPLLGDFLSAVRRTHVLAARLMQIQAEFAQHKEKEAS
ncbi:hypothetical protein [Escherichia coli]|uniref:hypothetical protein n=1 Tax=Escherichia coli TaxID=562 RepID=UPI00135DA8D6|nr:hypothetical protein [Escherichia coli]MXF04505.1 hypothetical protein [Escherichia coli]